jgi:hypothetical protein
MMSIFASFVLSLGSASRDQVGGGGGGVAFGLLFAPALGVIGYAAVPRCGLGPLPPPLCRCAERTADLISIRWWRLTGRTLAVSDLGKVANIQSPRTHHARCPGAWGEWRSGIKEEAAALGRNGGQPRSQSPQVPGRTQVQMPGHAYIQRQQSSQSRRTQKP